MNYLAHAWILPRATPPLVLGAALPDLMGAFDRKAPRLALESHRLEGEPELARGVRAHHVADVTFHELAAFREGCSALRAELAPLELERVRLFFVAHLLLEMLLDAALLESEPGFGATYFAALAEAPVARAALLCAGEAAPGFEAFLGRFVRARFLLDYATDEGLVFRLEQVLSRVRQTLGEGGGQRLGAALPRLRSLVRPLVPALTEEPRRAVLSALG